MFQDGSHLGPVVPFEAMEAAATAGRLGVETVTVTFGILLINHSLPGIANAMKRREAVTEFKDGAKAKGVELGTDLAAKLDEFSKD